MSKENALKTAHDTLLGRVDNHGQVVGFTILGISHFCTQRPFEAELTASK